MEVASNILGVANYKFLSEPADALKCLICLEVAEEPWQHSKCGRLFCEKCLNSYGRDKPCSNCRMEKPQYFEDSKSKREVRSLSVKCNNMEKNNKCWWIGTVGTLHNHLTTCNYTPIPCPNKCEIKKGEIKTFTRRDLKKHLPHCPNREFECKYCGEKGTYAMIKDVHDDVCEKKVIPCPSADCPKTIQRQQLDRHLQLECEYTVIGCKHKDIGCDTRLERKDMAAHEQDDKFHLHMAINTVTLLKEHCGILSYMQKKNSMVFRLTQYQDKKEKKSIFQSPSFYTGPNGYHINTWVYANGRRDAKGTHLSVFAHFLEGEHNAELNWPFVGKITVTLLNQEKDKDHYERTMSIPNTYNIIPGSSRGYCPYIPHSELESKPYLKDDTLYFRVSVEVADSKPWLECTAH